MHERLIEIIHIGMRCIKLICLMIIWVMFDSDKDSASDEDDGSRGDGGVEGLGVLLGQKINLFMMLKMMETCRP